MTNSDQHTYDCKVREERVYISPHLMRNRCLKPCFLSRSLSETWPDECNVQNPEILEYDAAAEAECLDNEIVEEIVRSFGQIGSKNSGDVGWIVDDEGDSCDDARAD